MDTVSSTSHSWQTLPWNIVLRIGHFVSNKDLQCRVAFADENQRDSPFPLTKFLSICKDWRMVTLPETCKTLAISATNDKKKRTELYYPHWSTESMPPNASYHLVKTVSIDVLLKHLLNGEMLEKLQSDCSHMQMEKAVKLELTLVRLGRNESADSLITARTSEHVHKLAEYLREIIPCVKSIQLSFFHISPEITLQINMLVNHLQTMFQTTVQISIHPSSISIIDGSGPINVPGCLTTIKCWWDGYYALSKELILQNTQSLKYLEIIFSHAIELNDLIEDSNDGHPIVYPQMEKLRLIDSLLEDADFEPNTQSTEIQFPKLRYLMIDIPYPFTDDVLFRGNQQTLKFLYIRPDPLVTKILLHQYRVFANHLFAKLYHVMVMPPVIEFEKEQWPEERFDLPLSSSNAIQSLVLEHMRDIKPFINVLPGFAHNLSNLYILSMRATHVAMDSVIAMVKYLPALHEFHSRFGGFSPEFHLPEDKIQCMETCAVASSRLAIWEIWDAKIDECGALAYSCVLLSVACKSFASLVYVEPEYSTMVAFNKALETLGKLPDFAAYSENIARLRFKTELD